MTSPLEHEVEDEADTGLPLLPTWRAVYLFVMAVFVLWIVLLTAFTRMFA
jgi:hypothetical protein